MVVDCFIENQEKLIGKTLEFQTLNFLNSKEKNKLDKDKPTFVNFWFMSCSPCIEEMPALNELKEKYKDRTCCAFSIN